MCGVNAVYSFSNTTSYDRELIQRMNQEISYRGPDDQGIWSDATVCLGAVRLAIIGLRNGHQPIVNESEKLVLACNGEIYNHAELKSLLSECGHKFRTDTDIEVLLHLYEEYGRDFVNRIKGMFAFVIYDSTKRLLLAGRDRLGEKPLYYSQMFGKFIVSSEAKAIAVHCDQEVTSDQRVVLESNYSAFPQDPERTLFNEIRRVLPGECIEISDCKIDRWRYWNGRRRVSFSGSKPDAVEETARLLSQAVERTMIAEVPVAVLLSGGVDSSAIAAYARQFSSNLSAISVGYEGQSPNDERSLARRLAKDLHIDLHEIELTGDDFVKAFDEYFTALDEPIWDPASIMQWYIFKKSSDLGFKVLLSGQGADEIFFGYPSHITEALHMEHLRQISAHLPISKKNIRTLLRLLCSSPRKILDLLRSRGDDGWQRMYLDKGLKTPDFSTPRSVFWSYVNSDSNCLEARFNYLREIYLSTNGFLQTDKLSMAHSCEVRCPFADVDLVEFVQSLPLTFVIGDKSPKLLLREAVTSKVPDYILKQPKRGFQPAEDCLRKLTKKFTVSENHWVPMAQEITKRITANIANLRSERISGYGGVESQEGFKNDHTPFV
jgi:asparagine synthase (glutamine-hydrolysing)